MHCLRNCSCKFAIFASSIFSLIWAAIKSWILKFWHLYNLNTEASRVIFKTHVYRTHRTSAQLFAVMFVLKVTASHFVSKSQQSPSIISFGQSIIECIVYNFSRVHKIGSREMQIFNVLFIFIFYLYISIVFLYVLSCFPFISSLMLLF